MTQYIDDILKHNYPGTATLDKTVCERSCTSHDLTRIASIIDVKFVSFAQTRDYLWFGRLELVENGTNIAVLIPPKEEFEQFEYDDKTKKRSVQLYSDKELKPALLEEVCSAIEIAFKIYFPKPTPLQPAYIEPCEWFGQVHQNYRLSITK